MPDENKYLMNEALIFNVFLETERALKKIVDEAASTRDVQGS
jgi:hypothetical protein